ncbi:MAG TPA: tetratricopeptide repeat protein, partial [Spirochaetota bacterium]|nr:tetratricopeptide repeat protein [Spirochaetota bacterium]
KIYPQINYFYAKYMRFMNTSSEEKIFLENAEKSFEVMKKVDPVRYETSYYRNILSKVYNDLGESYDRFSKINIKAEEYYLKSIDANPENGKPYYNLGNFALKNKVDYDGALKNYLFAEKYGFSNDTQNYNMGWLYYKKDDFYMSYNKIGKLLDKYPDNSNLKFMIGSIFYKMNNYELSEGMLLETYNHFEALRQINYPVDMSTKEGRAIITMLTKVSNNLGASLQKRYEQTKNSKYIVWATKYYSDSIEFFAKMKDIPEDIKKEESFQIDERVRYKKFDIENANQNLRMTLYPEAGFDEPILYDDFSLDFKTTM